MKIKDKKFSTGDRVKSLYRARWLGVILSEAENPEGCYRVLMTHDRCGNPVRLRKIRTLHSYWLEKIC